MKESRRSGAARDPGDPIPCTRCGQTVAHTAASDDLIRNAARNHQRYCRPLTPRPATSPTAVDAAAPAGRTAGAHGGEDVPARKQPVLPAHPPTKKTRKPRPDKGRRKDTAMARTEQCATCDTIWELVNTGTREIGNISAALGQHPDKLRAHLAAHGQASDQLRALIVEPSGRPLQRQTNAPTPAPEPATTPGVDHTPTSETSGGDWPEDTDPQELVAAGLATPDQLEDPTHPTQATETWGHVPADPTTISRITSLAKDHPSQDVRAAAAALLAELDVYENTVLDRLRLEQLTAQRDQITAEIDKLTARIRQPHPIASAITVNGDIHPGAVQAALTSPNKGLDMADVREWGRANGYQVKPTGKISALVINVYRAAQAAS